jgi:hypothetical protein
MAVEVTVLYCAHMWESSMVLAGIRVQMFPYMDTAPSVVQVDHGSSHYAVQKHWVDDGLYYFHCTFVAEMFVEA